MRIDEVLDVAAGVLGRTVRTTLTPNAAGAIGLRFADVEGPGVAARHGRIVPCDFEVTPVAPSFAPAISRDPGGLVIIPAHQHDRAASELVAGDVTVNTFVIEP